MRHAAPRVPKILHLELAVLFATQRVMKQCRQDGAVVLLLDRFITRPSENIAGLMIANGRCLAFAALGLRPLDAALSAV
jgi:hypothetical protein